MKRCKHEDAWESQTNCVVWRTSKAESVTAEENDVRPQEGACQTVAHVSGTLELRLQEGERFGRQLVRVIVT